MPERRLAYLCLQATTEGQASYAHVHEIIAGLRELGWHVDLFQPSYAGGTAPGALGRFVEFVRVQRRLVSTLRTGAYHALYVRGHALAWPAARAARRLGIPVVQECNGPYGDFYAVWPRARLFAPVIESMTRAQLRWADARIAVTDELASWIESETGKPAVVIGNGANTELFRPDAPSSYTEALPQRYAVFFGALSPWQEVPVLLDAARQEHWPGDVSLVLAGDGHLRADSERAAADTPRIALLGTIPYAEIGGLVARATCSLILKSESYTSGPSPVKLYESMACGVPVVATDIPGVGSIIRSHGCGVAIEHNTPETVAKAVAYLATNTDEAAEMGARGRAAVLESYSWRARAKASSAVLTRVLRSSR